MSQKKNPYAQLTSYKNQRGSLAPAAYAKKLISLCTARLLMVKMTIKPLNMALELTLSTLNC